MNMRESKEGEKSGRKNRVGGGQKRYRIRGRLPDMWMDINEGMKRGEKRGKS